MTPPWMFPGFSLVGRLQVYLRRVGGQTADERNTSGKCLEVKIVIVAVHHLIVRYYPHQYTVNL